MKNELGDKWARRGGVVVELVLWAPLPMLARAQLLSSLVLPASLYGSCVSCLSTDLLMSLTSAVMRAVWGVSRKLSCRDIVLTLLVPGHLVDLRQAIIY